MCVCVYVYVCVCLYADFTISAPVDFQHSAHVGFDNVLFEKHLEKRMYVSIFRHICLYLDVDVYL